jgi:nicotinamidase-related amidase
MTDPVLDGLRRELHVAPAPYSLADRASGLVLVDLVNGFCTVGAGNLAPVEPDEQIAGMVEASNRLAHEFAEAKRPILAFLDTHEPGKPEPPYPPHCERGTGEENLVPELAWLESCPEATLIRKDCINGFVGAIEAVHDGRHGVHHNKVVDWINTHRLETVVVTGICSDICVMDFVLTLLSARNHGMTPSLRDVVVHEPATATYHLPRAVVESQGLHASFAHPQPHTHHVALYFMASRGAILASELN